GVRMRVPDSLPPHRIEKTPMGEDLRRRVCDVGVFNQDLRQLRGLVGRAGRRQPQPARVLLLLRKQPMISSTEMSVVEGDADIRGADRKAGRFDLGLSSGFRYIEFLHNESNEARSLICRELGYIESKNLCDLRAEDRLDRDRISDRGFVRSEDF